MPHPGQNNARPLRRIVTIADSVDPATGLPITVPLQEQQSSYSSQGSIDTVNTLGFFKCGHSTDHPMGGRCVVCGGVSCQTCQKSCICGAPLCPEHGRPDEKTGEVLCRRCGEGRRRKRTLTSILRIAVSPFITFRGQERGR
jgi:hypothetical protein